jgi:RNA polymerase sigma-70 factor (ECF subfamily)
MFLPGIKANLDDGLKKVPPARQQPSTSRADIPGGTEFCNLFLLRALYNNESIIMEAALDKISEKEMVEAARRDPAAFGALFDLYHLKILKYAAYRTGNAEAAKDITGETFFKALNKLWQFRWRGASFSALLYRIASNEVNMYFRSKKYAPASLDELIENSPSYEPRSSNSLNEELENAQKAIDNNSLFALVHAELVKLPPLYQEVLSMRFFDSMKISEISAALNKKAGTVKSILSRGLSMIRGSMQPNPAAGIIYDAGKNESEGL